MYTYDETASDSWGLNFQKYLFKYLEVPANWQPYLYSTYCVTQQSSSYQEIIYAWVWSKENPQSAWLLRGLWY